MYIHVVYLLGMQGMPGHSWHPRWLRHWFLGSTKLYMDTQIPLVYYELG
jgi:hypothetical protein